jgi:hypothetical protein
MNRIGPAVGVSLLAALLLPSALGQGVDLPALEPSPAMATRLRWLQYTMVSGRVVVSSSHTTRITVPLQVSLDGRRRERQSLNINNALTNVQYELTTPVEQLSVTVTDSSQLAMSRVWHDGKYNLQFEQIPGKPLMLTVAEGSSKRSLEAESFWHLLIAEPEAVRRHLIPVLEMLHPLWQLSDMGRGIEDLLFERAQSQPQPDRQRWAGLVADLASSKFSVRQNAERELSKAGQVVVPYLQNLDRAQLDAEQAYRVRSLVESLAVGYEDTADRIVIWLSGDEHVWLSLLARGEPQKRRVAAEQLSAIIGPIEFDPVAADSVRDSQLQRLRVRLQRPLAIKK